MNLFHQIHTFCIFNATTSYDRQPRPQSMPTAVPHGDAVALDAACMREVAADVKLAAIDRHGMHLGIEAAAHAVKRRAITP